MLQKTKKYIEKIYPTQNSIVAITKFFKLDYVTSVTNEIVNKLWKFKIKAACVNKNNLETSLFNITENKDKYKGGVYHIKHNNWSNFKQNKRNIGMRTQKKHSSSQKEIKKVFATHFIDSDYIVSRNIIYLFCLAKKIFNLLE